LVQYSLTGCDYGARSVLNRRGVIESDGGSAGEVMRREGIEQAFNLALQRSGARWNPLCHR
jgi:hypothetical protein